MRRWIGTAFVVGLAGCTRVPAAPPSEAKGAEQRDTAVVVSAPPPAVASAAGSAAPTEARAPAPRAGPRWTTLTDSDVCIELEPTTYTDYATFATQPECKAWTESRRCRPGFHCFDGCNWRNCNDSGSAMETTLAGCSPGIVQFVFEAGQSKLGPSAHWPAVIDMITGRLRAPQRKLQIRGYAGPDEAKSAAGVARLARTRAEAVARELAQRGISRQRLVIEAGSAAEIQEIQERSPTQVASLVTVSVLPEHSLRDDFEPKSSEYRLFCGARPGG
jgi:outer membrane protein OmpA-like peptidoglycan-associated protein